MKVKYITPAKQRENVTRVAKTSNDDIIISDRKLKGKTVGKLLIIKEPKGMLEYDVLYYSTNIRIKKQEAHFIKATYKARWGIETGFSQLAFFRSITTSRESFIRSFFYGSSIVVYNLWILANLIVIILFFKTIPKKYPIPKKVFSKFIREDVPD